MNYYQDMELMEENKQPELDTRKFSIYVQINDRQPIKISDLDISEYLKLKNDDEYILQYCQDNYNEEIINLFRSLDDVDYTAVPVPMTELQLTEIAEDVNEICENIQQNIDLSIEEMNIPNNNADVLQPSCSSTSQKSKCKIQSSITWNHIEKIKNKNLLRCVYCKKEYKACGNTTNMLKHLKTQHPLFFQTSSNSSNSSNTKINKVGVKRSIQEVKSTKPICSSSKKTCTSSLDSCGIREAFSHVNSYKEGGSMSDKITNAILFMICKDLLPISTVEHEGFLALLEVLAPLYKAPSKKTMTKKLESRYNIMKQTFIKDLQDVDCYCVTCDNWTDCSKQSYLGVTIHYLKNFTKMKSGCLGCIPLHERHTADYLKRSLQELLEEFNLTHEKLTAIISDGEPAIKKACIELCGKDTHLVCIAHVVAHLLPDALKNFLEFTTIIDTIKSIVSTIRRSIPASDKLKEIQFKSGKTEGTSLRLIQDVPTRWTTTVDMIERYLELEEYIYVAMSECENPIDVLNREEIKVLKDIFPMMAPVRNVITEISGDQYPTCSIIIPIVRCMEQSINSANPQTEMGKTFKAKLQNAILNRFKNFEHYPLLSIATILDPRFKKIHFRDPLAVSSAINKINGLIKSITPDTATNRPQKKESNSIWDFHDSLNIEQQCTSTADPNLRRNIELQQYLEIQRISRQEDIFKYWTNVERTFPFLWKLALRQLSIIATTVPSERMFSRAGLIKRDNRNKLTGTHLNMLLFLSSLTREDWCVG